MTMPKDEITLLNEANRKLFASILAGVGIVAATASAGGVWAWRIDSGLTEAKTTLVRIAVELERRPTAAEVNLQWRTLQALNPTLKVGPLLDNYDGD